MTETFPEGSIVAWEQSPSMVQENAAHARGTVEEVLSDADRIRLQETIDKMSRVSSLFYASAVQCGNHAFIEFCGLMNEYIKACELALAQGLDFTNLNVHCGRHLPFQPYFAAYLGEKLGCIYGPGLSKAALEVSSRVD